MGAAARRSSPRNSASASTCIRPWNQDGGALRYEFQSNLASITLRLSVSPDAEVRKLIFTYDVDIVPILMKFDSHDELELPLDAVIEREACTMARRSHCGLRADLFSAA